MSLNSVLLDGDLVGLREKKNRTGWWLLVRAGSRKNRTVGRSTFRVEVPNSIREGAKVPLAEGATVRVLGRLAKASKIGTFIISDVLEVKPAVQAVTP